jgi:hypothetical protein
MLTPEFPHGKNGEKKKTVAVIDPLRRIPLANMRQRRLISTEVRDGLSSASRACMLTPMSTTPESMPPNQPPHAHASAMGLESGVRMLVPRAGGRVIARFTTVIMTLVVAAPNEIYLPVVALAVFWIAVAAGWNGSVNLPLGIGRICGQLREHLFRVTADWFTVGGYLIVSLLWTFLDPRPYWLNAIPVLLVAFACWTASFAALPMGAMGRWFAFQWRLIAETLGGPFRGKKQDEPEKPLDAGPAPTPINPIESTHWPSQQQERFDDWLAEEVRRFEAEEAAPTTINDGDGDEDNSAESTQEFGAVTPEQGASPLPPNADFDEVDPDATQHQNAPANGGGKIKKLK